MKQLLSFLQIMMICTICNCRSNSYIYQPVSNNVLYSIQTNVEKIKNPLKLEYTYYQNKKMEDGTPIHSYTEQGKEVNEDGDYIWMKTAPFYASHEVKCTYEYQMDFTDEDFYALKNWLIEVIGPNVRSRSVDNPFWYNEGMSLTESYYYCRENNKYISMQYFNKADYYIVTIIIDSGSAKTNTSGEMAIVWTFYKE